MIRTVEDADQMLKRRTLQEIAESQDIQVDKKRQSIENLLGIKSLACDERSNCFAYALGLHQSEDYYATAADYYKATKDKGSYHASPAFVDFLLKEGILISIKQPYINRIILYFDNKNYPTHAGIVIKPSTSLKEQMIESKWGQLSLFQHKTWEVPTFYGNTIKYYVTPNLKIIENCFKNFCHELYDNKNNS